MRSDSLLSAFRAGTRHATEGERDPSPPPSHDASLLEKQREGYRNASIFVKECDGPGDPRPVACRVRLSPLAQSLSVTPIAFSSTFVALAVTSRSKTPSLVVLPWKSNRHSPLRSTWMLWNVPAA